MNHPIRRSTFPLAAGAALLLAGSAAWSATGSSFAESRGYQACVDAAAHQTQLIKVDGDYFVYDHSDGARRFYLNGYAFRNGDSEPVKIACDTTRSGHRLLNVSVDEGRYAGRIVQPLEVAVGN